MHNGSREYSLHGGNHRVRALDITHGVDVDYEIEININGSDWTIYMQHSFIINSVAGTTSDLSFADLIPIVLFTSKACRILR